MPPKKTKPNKGDDVKLPQYNKMAVFKLDKNFHVYIHGGKEMIEVGRDEKGKYLKLYFKSLS